MFLLIKSCAQIFMTMRTNRKHRLPDTYIIKDYANVIKITSNSTQNRQKIQKAQNDKKN